MFTDFVVLILVPSRELAIQIEEVVQSLIRNTVGVRTALLIGGESREQQLYRLRQNVNVFIATPGRLNDLLTSAEAEGRRVLQHVRTVVLDEADQLMKSDFQNQVMFEVEFSYAGNAGLVGMSSVFSKSGRFSNSYFELEDTNGCAFGAANPCDGG